jgi:hypothetical protein
VRRFVPLALGLAALLASPARAQSVPGCPAAITAWADGCAEVEVRALACPSGRAVFAVGTLRVEVARDLARAFAAAGELGASPIGEFPDWSAAPAADRAAFEALLGCLRARPGELVEALDPDPAPATLRAGRASEPGDAAGPPLPPLPLRLLAGLAIALALLSRRFGAAGLLRRAAPPLGLALLTFAARRLLVPERFFHQNGHGATWVEYALGRATPYGPGFEELLGLARLAADADGAVFLLVGALSALVPAAVFATARGVGARAELAWAAALCVALAPLPARLSGSESYFAVGLALNALAAAVLVLGAPPGASAVERSLAAAAAGLIVAQAARVHPLLWLSAALLPGVLLVVRGARSERAAAAALATAIVALVVALAAGPAMLRVLSGPLGAAWLGPARAADDRVPPGWILAALAGAFAALFVRGPRRPIAHAFALAALSAVVAWRGNLLGPSPPWTHEAYGWLFAPVVLAALVGLVPAADDEAGAGGPAVRWQRGAAAVLLVLGAVGLAFGRERAFTLPTDAREAALVRSWRAHLPAGAAVAHVERAERQILALPLRGFFDVPLVCGEPAPDLMALGHDVFVYRASLCASERGRACCAALEAGYLLEPFAAARLPAIESMGGLGYDTDPVEVGLFRVRGRASEGAPPSHVP